MKLRLYSLVVMCFFAFAVLPGVVSIANADIAKDMMSDHDDAMEEHDEWKKEHAEARKIIKKARPLLKWLNGYMVSHSKAMDDQDKKIARHEIKMTAHKKSKDPTVAKLRESHNKLMTEHKEMEEAHKHLMDDFDDFASIIEKIEKLKDEIAEHKLKEKTKKYHK